MPGSEFQSQCKHTYLPQTRYPGTSLPPVYTYSHLGKETLKELDKAAISKFLGRPRVRGPFVLHTVKALRNELEEGMSRERREQMMLYVLSLQDPSEKRAAELYLARYPGFFLYGGADIGGTGGEEVGLDFSVGDRFVDDGVCLGREKRKLEREKELETERRRQWYEGWFERDMERGSHGRGGDEDSEGDAFQYEDGIGFERDRGKEGWCVVM